MGNDKNTDDIGGYQTRSEEVTVSLGEKGSKSKEVKEKGKEEK